MGNSRFYRLQSDGNTVKQKKGKSRHLLENLEEMEEPCSSERSLPSSSGRGRGDAQTSSDQHERKQTGQERLRKPPLPKISGEVFLSTDSDDWEAKSSPRTRSWEKQSRHHGRLSPKSSQKTGLPSDEIVCGRELGQGDHRERRRKPRTPPFSEDEELQHHHDAGNGSPVGNPVCKASQCSKHCTQPLSLQFELLSLNESWSQVLCEIPIDLRSPEEGNICTVLP